MEPTTTRVDNLRMAMVLTSFSESGGLELYAHRLIEGLVARGARVTVVCEKRESKFEHPHLSVVQFAAAPKGSKKWQRILHANEAASRAVEEAGKFDIIHSQHLAIKKSDVVTFHNHTASRLSHVGQGWERALNQLKMRISRAYQLRDQFDRQLCYQSRCLIAPAKICLEDFRTTYEVDKHNASVSYAVAPPGATAAVNQSHTTLENQPFTFLFVGKGFRKKGLDILLDACAKLKARGKSFRLLIAGLRAKPLDKLRLKVLDLASQVTYLGFCRDMNSVYARAQAIILPSRIEPFGMAPIEGMLHGLVPIVSKVCGVAEVLHDGQDALILQNHLDADELASLMQRLIDDSQMQQRMSQAARATAQTCTWERTVESTIAAYQMLLSPRS